MPDSKAWSPVWLGWHDPPVIVYQSDTVEQFLLDAIAMQRAGPRSPIDIVREDVTSWVYRENPGSVDRATALTSNDLDMRAFAKGLPDGACIVDLRVARMGDGITWGRFGSRTLNFRHGAERIWASAPPLKQPSFFERLFGK